MQGATLLRSKRGSPFLNMAPNPVVRAHVENPPPLRQPTVQSVPIAFPPPDRLKTMSQSEGFDPLSNLGTQW